MSFDFDPIYLVYVLVAASAGLFAEGFYLLCFSGASYRTHVNRRLKLMKDQPDRESILVQLRKERGLTGSGDYRLSSVNFNKLVLQSGLTVGIGRLALFVAFGAIVAFIAAVTASPEVRRGRQPSPLIFEQSNRTTGTSPFQPRSPPVNS